MAGGDESMACDGGWDGKEYGPTELGVGEEGLLL